jgi:hypothetical protein
MLGYALCIRCSLSIEKYGKLLDLNIIDELLIRYSAFIKCCKDI